MAHELGIVAAWIVATICLALLSKRGWLITKQRRMLKLSPQGWQMSGPQYRFGLADLLLFFTLLAAVIDALIGITNEEELGIPEFNLSKEIDDVMSARPTQ